MGAHINLPFGFATHLVQLVKISIYLDNVFGFMHLGGLRTALYNYLFAKQNKGTFILRIEDTDQTRFVPGATDQLIKVLSWATIPYDEGPGREGEFGPHVQSARTALYQKYANDLLERGHAYRCFCTTERLQLLRTQGTHAGSGTHYDRFCLRLPEKQIAEKLSQKMPHTIRMKVPDNGTTMLHDIVRGSIRFTNNFIDDQVLLKSDGFPTYHLANVVDDHLMKISHVIRGEEWITSTPKHLMLYDAFGWKPPQFAHLPLLLNADKSKLSKRQSDVSVDHYMEQGFLPEAVINFVSLLGWAPSSSSQEIFTLDQLVETFSLEKVHRAGAAVDFTKLTWMNNQHWMRLAHSKPQVLLPRVKALLTKHSPSLAHDDEYLLKVIPAVAERINRDVDFLGHMYFFQEPDFTTEEARKMKAKVWKSDSAQLVAQAVDALQLLPPDPSVPQLTQCLDLVVANAKVKNPQLFSPLRYLLTGVTAGIGVPVIMSLIGVEGTLTRLRKQPPT